MKILFQNRRTKKGEDVVVLWHNYATLNIHIISKQPLIILHHPQGFLTTFLD
jgi:hypothetical protein